MKVEKVEQTEDQVIELAKNQEMKSLMDGASSPLVNDSDHKELEPEVKKDEGLAAQDDDANKEPEVIEPTLEEKLQAQSELIAKLQRSLDKTNGTYGNEVNHLRRKVAELESRKLEQRQFNLTSAQLKRISEQYPELAEALAEDLTDAFGEKVEANQQEPQSQEPVNDPRVDELSRSTNKMADQLKQIALNELTRVHADWRDVASWNVDEIPGVGNVVKWKNPAFGEWIDKQDSDIREIVFNSDDVSAIAGVITKFKDSTKSNNQQEQTIQTKPSVNKKLEKAVLPTGRRTGAHELMTDDDIIQQAMRDEQKRIMNGY